MACPALIMPGKLHRGWRTLFNSLHTRMDQKTTKNQHYVPQCLLKNFSVKHKKDDYRINIFDVTKKTTRFNQSTKEVFSQNFFYDKDNKVEQFLSNKIEDKAAIEIANIIEGDLCQIKDFSTTLLKFISVQLYRTPEAISQPLEFINSFFKPLAMQHVQAKGYDLEQAQEAISGLRLLPKDIRSFRSRLALQGILASKLLEDLKFHLIINNSDVEFFISDHPVNQYNWLYRDLDSTSATALTARGVQIFMPISADKLICLYDPKVYKYGNKNDWSTATTNNKDVIILNELQAINTSSVIGFKSRTMESEVVRLATRFKDISLFETKSILSAPVTINEQQSTSTQITYRKQRKIKILPSFIVLRKNARGFAKKFEERDPELSHGYRQILNYVAKLGLQP
jgi:hypothetical protein